MWEVREFIYWVIFIEPLDHNRQTKVFFPCCTQVLQTISLKPDSLNKLWAWVPRATAKTFVLYQRVLIIQFGDFVCIFECFTHEFGQELLLGHSVVNHWHGPNTAFCIFHRRGEGAFKSKRCEAKKKEKYSLRETDKRLKRKRITGKVLLRGTQQQSMKPWPRGKHINFATLAKRKCIIFHPVQDWTNCITIFKTIRMVLSFHSSQGRHMKSVKIMWLRGGKEEKICGDRPVLDTKMWNCKTEDPGKDALQGGNTCPRGWLLRVSQGDMSGDIRGWNGFFAPEQGEIQECVSESMNWGGRTCKIVESWAATTGISYFLLRKIWPPGHILSQKIIAPLENCQLCVRGSQVPWRRRL